MTGTVVLGSNQYGKAEIRLVRITRDTPRHEIEDLNVTSLLRGDFRNCYETGDNSAVIATDTQKNTVYAFAKEFGIGSPEAFLLRLGRHFVADYEGITGGLWEAEQYGWERIQVNGAGHDHSFVRTGQETRTAAVVSAGGRETVLGGLDGLLVLKSTGSEFHGFPRDKYTTLPETTDRVMATSVTARWRFRGTDADFNSVYAGVKSLLLQSFAELHSLSLQQTLFAMGKSVLDAYPGIAEIRLALPNKHHFLVDLEPFGLQNNNEVFYAADRAYGLMNAAITREGEPETPQVWENLPGFC